MNLTSLQSRMLTILLLLPSFGFGGSPEEARRIQVQLRSPIRTEREHALRLIVAGAGNSDNLTDLADLIKYETRELLDPVAGEEMLEAFGERDDRLFDFLEASQSELNKEYSERIGFVFSAIEVLESQFPERASEVLFSLQDSPEPEVLSRAARLLFKAQGPHLEAFIRARLADRKLLETDGPKLMNLAREMSSSLAAEVIGEGLSSGNNETIIMAESALREQLGDGAEPTVFRRLLPNIVQLLRSDRALKTPFSTARLVAALAAERIFAPNTPELRAAISYAYRRKTELGKMDHERRWVEILAAAAGRKPAIRSEAEEETLIASESLDSFLRILRGRKEAEDRLIVTGTSEVPKREQRWMAREAANDLQHIDPTEARDYVERLLKMAGNKVFKIHLALGLRNSSAPHLTDLTNSVARCAKLLQNYDRWKERREGRE
jgi:hypothetical protein